MKRDELIQQMHDLQQSKIPYDDVYHTIHEFGRENFREARPVVESFLTHEDEQFRYIALQVLTHSWQASS
jgi:hypothetical protein